MSADLATHVATPAIAEPNSRRWLVAPWFDLLFIANITWPLVVCAQLGDGFAARGGVQFWQIYYVTTPHRWITLVLVFLDRDRFSQRRGTFLGIAAAIALACVAVDVLTGALTCLLAIDYVWNAWHFAAQHHGIYGIYQRRSQTSSRWLALERWTMRGFLLYVTLRIASATWSDPSWDSVLGNLDWISLLGPAMLLGRAFLNPRAGWGGIVYLVSVCTLYTSLLLAVHARWVGLVLCLTTASALFHATEYLALVSWSVRQRHGAVGDQMGVLGYMAPRWGLTIAVFALVLGVGGWLANQWLVDVWLLLNVIVAFLHYSFDGMIWKRPSSPTVPLETT